MSAETMAKSALELAILPTWDVYNGHKLKSLSIQCQMSQIPISSQGGLHYCGEWCYLVCFVSIWGSVFEVFLRLYWFSCLGQTVEKPQGCLKKKKSRIRVTLGPLVCVWFSSTDSIPWVYVNTMGVVNIMSQYLYHESWSIPWVHVYTISSCQ